MATQQSETDVTNGMPPISVQHTLHGKRGAAEKTVPSTLELQLLDCSGGEGHGEGEQRRQYEEKVDELHDEMRAKRERQSAKVEPHLRARTTDEPEGGEWLMRCKPAPRYCFGSNQSLVQLGPPAKSQLGAGCDPSPSSHSRAQSSQAVSRELSTHTFLHRAPFPAPRP